MLVWAERLDKVGIGVSPWGRPSTIPGTASLYGLHKTLFRKQPMLDIAQFAGAGAHDLDSPHERPVVADNDAGLLDAYSHAVTSVADKVGPAVVRVETRAANGRTGGVGSGVVIAPDGLVLTNSHVVEGAKELRLTDPEGRSMDARVIGEDPDTDLALVRAGAARNLVSASSPNSRASMACPSASMRRSSRAPAAT